MGSTQEVTIDTAAGTGDQTTGGVRVNYVPRDGGNDFRLSLFATGANSSFQGDNMTPELVARGLRQPNSLKQTYDVNPTGGGPHRAGQALVLQRHALPDEPELRGGHLRQQERRERERVDSTSRT